MKLSSRFQWLFGVGLLLLSISHWFPLGINLFELLSAFAHFSFVLALFVVLFAAVFRLYILSVSGLVSALICGVLVVPHFTSMETSEGAGFTIGQFNVYHDNKSPQLVISKLSSTNADIFALQELNAEWKPLVDSAFRESHPYRMEEYWDNCCFGIGLYSRYPFLFVQVAYFEEIPYIEATVDVDGLPIRIISFHTAPPAFPNRTAERNAQMKLVASKVVNERTTIVFGDWNIVPWDAEVKRFMKETGLSALRDGFQPTYPMDIGVPLIPIDYITYSKGLVPISSETISIPGSDHKGLVGSFHFVN